MAYINSYVTALQSDVILSNILTGGVYNSSEVERIGKTETPAAYDPSTQELMPCALVTLPSTIGIANSAMTAVTGNVVEIYIYQFIGYSSIDSALARIYDITNNQYFAPTTPAYAGASLDTAWVMEFTNSIPRAFDDSLKSNLGRAEYNVFVRNRGVIC